MDLAEIALKTQLTPEVVQQRTRVIYEHLLGRSRHLQSGNFRSIHGEDLATLFESYDSAFFRGACLASLGGRRLDFRVSTRMTSAGGKTFHYTPRTSGAKDWYEIAVSAPLLFQTFRDVNRPVTVCGVSCKDRLEALQRIFEHEMIHLVELVAWKNSECSAPRFQSITSRLFQHREHTHNLITQSERAKVKFGIVAGSRVQFEYEGRLYSGIVNRVTKRATILVEDPGGLRYSDGKRYTKFYIPLDHLLPERKSG
ncbi:MAG: SprT-like family protein [Planctomycetota bacterium]|nr:MAG: SprT-like family protein [Planctomycetota bacterium]